MTPFLKNVFLFTTSRLARIIRPYALKYSRKAFVFVWCVQPIGILVHTFRRYMQEKRSVSSLQICGDYIAGHERSIPAVLWFLLNNLKERSYFWLWFLSIQWPELWKLQRVIIYVLEPTVFLELAYSFCASSWSKQCRSFLSVQRFFAKHTQHCVADWDLY